MYFLVILMAYLYFYIEKDVFYGKLLRIAEALNIDAGRLLNQKHLNNEGNRYYPTDKTWRSQ